MDLLPTLLAPFFCDPHDVTFITFADNKEEMFNPKTQWYTTNECMAFGSNDWIFGYTNLMVKLFFSKRTFQCYMETHFHEAIPFPNSLNLRTTMLSPAYCNYLPNNVFDNLGEYLPCLEEENREQVFGDICHYFNHNNKRYIVSKNNGSTKALRDFHRRFEILLGWWSKVCTTKVCLGSKDWIVYYLYECEGKTRTPVGFVSVFLKMHSQEKCVAKIQHFFILPTHQHQGLGQCLLKFAYISTQVIENVTDIIVINPSPAFNKMRDLVDTSILLRLEILQPSKLPSAFTPLLESTMKSSLCIEPHQAKRVYEIIRLYYVQKEGPEKYNEFLNYLNEQYRFNYYPNPTSQEADDASSSKPHKDCTIEEYIEEMEEVAVKLKHKF